MSIQRARAHLEALGMQDRIREFPVSSATVELAALAESGLRKPCPSGWRIR